MKMRGLTESHNLKHGDLSTFFQKASGQGWITQRLIALRETMFRKSASIAFCEQFQTKRVEFDKAFRVLLIIGASVILKRHMRL